MSKLYQADMVKELSAETGHSAIICTSVVSAFKAALAAHMVAGDVVSLRGLGEFRLLDVGAKTLRNPQTGRPVQVPGHKRPAYRPSPALRARIKAATARPAPAGKGAR